MMGNCKVVDGEVNMSKVVSMVGRGFVDEADSYACDEVVETN